jgi:Domain of unknown function (DUF6602)
MRELLIDNILLPWLPPYVSCGTGMIIDMFSNRSASTQDDVVVYDRSLVPPVLASLHAPEGVFPFNSALTRIEVKSTLDRGEIVKFVKAAKELATFRFSVPKVEERAPLMGTLNMLFAFGSDAKGKGEPDYQLARLVEVMQEHGVTTESGIVSAICMPGYGLWKIAKNESQDVCWQRLVSDAACDHLAWFVATISNTCYQEHAARQGRDPSKGVEGGIGLYMPGGVWSWVKI